MKNYFKFAFGFSVIATASSSQAFSLWTQSLVGTSNTGNYIGTLDYTSSNDGSLTVANATKSFTGLNRSGATQTMTFTGETRSSADFGRLKVFTTGVVTNNYYNASNPIYYNSTTGVTNPNGSPESLISLGFAGFNDTLQFGGSLQAGYKARYVFHVDGTNSGNGFFAGMGVNIAGNDESFFALNPGYNNEIWATQAYDIDGINPQEIQVQFSDQFVCDTWLYADGATVSGTSDFSSTLVLDHIEVVDAQGNVVTDGITVTSASGTIYAVPEPASFAALGLGIMGFLKRRKASK